jgi:hypothetical protein
MAADCKSAGFTIVGSSNLVHQAEMGDFRMEAAHHN